MWFYLEYKTWKYLDTLRPRQNAHHFADDIFECIFTKKNLQISLKISLKFVPKFPIYKKYLSIDSDNGVAPAIDGLFTVA